MDATDATDATDAMNPRTDGHAAMRAPQGLRDAIEQLEHEAALDDVGERLAPIAAALNDGRPGEILRGAWLGHALHPLLTDLPLGCWMAASILDLTAPRRSRAAAQRLVGLGLLATPLTAAAGLADWDGVHDERARRVGVAHAVGNGAVGLAYLLSWRARRKGHHVRGTVFALAGGLGAIATGYLGGHLSFARGAGQGARGLAQDASGNAAPAAPTAPELGQPSDVGDPSAFPAAAI